MNPEYQVPENLSEIQSNSRESHRQKILSNLPQVTHIGMDKKVEDQLNVYLGLMKQGKNYNTTLRNKKEFSNMEMLNNNINIFDIDEYQSALPKNKFDLRAKISDPQEFYDGIAKRQGDLVLPKPSSNPAIQILDKEVEKGKKSLWDATADPGNDTDRYAKLRK